MKRGLFDVVFPLEPGQRSGIIGHHEELDQSYWIYRYDAAGKITSARKYSRESAVLEDKQYDQAPAAGTLAVPQEFYIMLTENKRLAHTRSLAEVQPEIEQNLINQELARQHKRWIDRLRRKAFVRYF